jgi:hypothetical protein
LAATFICASSLLLRVTTYITTDIASAPLLWIVPLALYLMTFCGDCLRQAAAYSSSQVRDTWQVFSLWIIRAGIDKGLNRAGRCW